MCLRHGHTYIHKYGEFSSSSLDDQILPRALSNTKNIIITSEYILKGVFLRLRQWYKLTCFAIKTLTAKTLYGDHVIYKPIYFRKASVDPMMFLVVLKAHMKKVWEQFGGSPLQIGLKKSENNKMTSFRRDFDFFISIFPLC